MQERLRTSDDRRFTSCEAFERSQPAIDVIIPALNEQDSLPLVLRDLPTVRQVIVVDNGSTDATAQVARDMGALVVYESKRGYGAACLRGLAAVQKQIESGIAPPKSVVFLDADYSDYPEYLSSLVAPISAGEFDFVLGSRLIGVREPGAMPLQSVFGNKLACFLMRWLFGIRYTDLGPFRAIRYQSLHELKMNDQNFGWTIEMQIKAARANLRIHEIAVPYRKRVGVSKISGTISGSIRAGVKILLTIAKYGFSRRTRKPPGGVAIKANSNSNQVVA